MIVVALARTHPLAQKATSVHTPHKFSSCPWQQVGVYYTCSVALPSQLVWFCFVSFWLGFHRHRAPATEMADWGPVVVAVVLFVLLSPGLLLQLPAKGGRFVEFGNFQTSGASIFVHAIIFFALAAVFLIAIGVHITTD